MFKRSKWTWNDENKASESRPKRICRELTLSCNPRIGGKITVFTKFSSWLLPRP
jgi:hypothetical protein